MVFPVLLVTPKTVAFVSALKTCFAFLFFCVKNVFTRVPKYLGNNTFNRKNVEQPTTTEDSFSPANVTMQSSFHGSKCSTLTFAGWNGIEWSAHDEGSFMANMNTKRWKRKISRFFLPVARSKLIWFTWRVQTLSSFCKAIRWLDQAIQQTIDILYHLIVQHQSSFPLCAVCYRWWAFVYLCLCLRLCNV